MCERERGREGGRRGRKGWKNTRRNGLDLEFLGGKNTGDGVDGGLYRGVEQGG